MTKNSLFAAAVLVLSSTLISVKGQVIHRMDPPNWWVQHPTDTVEVFFYGEGFTNAPVEVVSSNAELYEWGVFGDDLIWVQFWLRPEQTGSSVEVKIGEKSFSFPLYERTSYRPQGLNDQDLVYLITPDRFHNGSTKNDDVNGMRERGTNRKEPYARHGGDIKGIEQGLSYIRSLGATAIWINPLLENDMKRDSYHGYAITDHYQIDPRYGGNKALLALSKRMHENGIKHVADVVYNHWGSEHYLHKLLPDSSMVHWNLDGSIPYSSFRFTSLTDPYASKEDIDRFEKGWFAGAMPDLNQEHPLIISYLKYATLWYVEMFEVDALRCDTYAFAHHEFLSEINFALKRAYPELFIFGETWAYSEASQLYFAPNDNVSSGWTGNDAVTDFTLWRAIHNMYEANESEQFGWATGAGALYYRLAADYLYERPEDLITFIDNHDDGRFLGQLNSEDKLRSALTLLYFMRGIPVLYYGTELGLMGHENHGAIREDMPGFSKDFPDYSIIGGQLLNLCQELGAMRKNRGKVQFTQRVPEDGYYTIEAWNEVSKWVLVVNASDKTRSHEYWSGKKPVISSDDGEGALFHPWEAKIFEFDR